ncbi:DUF4192 domain-containing protein (plasmid) [Prescottella equi]|uniref:DUF4192 family protein n=1 Tax=Rhodococcus hoagii TaxID=43767 RepID=Q9ETY8_RHOHA|nr:DUF4192 domain-containing protein [Prescottella equi]AAG21730.1 unknown [Prescottella equi]ARX59030.1 hypothetical protein pVAPA1357_0050 [Prescottella equi]ARX59080.1 hypothetical protein pVAPA1422_0050 [Prescottella equi]ARX59162.1 hypothetical protein pVAPA1340_0050 [Prescottella equi]ARX59257.1 hypothetical protein pVAPA1637_0050 [Prescottella equi]
MTTNPIRISTATEIVTAVPALLGFIPQRSVVAILLDGAKVVCAIRVDAGMDHLATQLLPVAEKQAVDSMILVSVADAQHTDQSLATLEAIRATLATAGVETRRALHTAATEQGAEWTDIETGESGVVDNPSTTAANLNRLIEGRSFVASREAIEDIYAPTEVDPTAEINRARAIARIQGRDSFARTTITELAALVTDRQTPSAELAARVGVMMADDVEARDIVLGLAINAPIEAHDAVAAIARHLTGIERAEALTVAGYFAYVAGRGPDAGIAFAAAENAAAAAGEVPPRLLDLLNRALSSGMTPAQMRTLGDAGIEAGRKRRVSLTAS